MELVVLKIEDRSASDSSFFPVYSIANVIIADLSNTLQRWTNDKIKAVVHRVTAPRDIKAGRNKSLMPGMIFDHIWLRRKP